ncbi:MAG: uracil-DNA glycosylase family protein [Chitinophagales bacterium]
MSAINSSTFADKAIKIFSSLELNSPEVPGIKVLNPYENQETQKCVTRFFQKYFNDERQRIFLFGINPGRLGGGLTGISFTDPVALRNFCGIENDLGNKRELSSEFIYKVIEAFGGAEKFYRHFFISAVCPLGFVKGKINYNYYDDKKLCEAVSPFIRKTWKQQIDMGADRKAVICIGSGKNRKMLEKLNAAYGCFERIISLEHPRFIMQYRRKKLSEYIDLYVKTLGDLIGDT